MSDGHLLSNVKTNLTTNTGNISQIETINKAVFIQQDDTIYPFADYVELKFPKFTQSGDIDINNNIFTTQLIGNVKILINISLNYMWFSDYAPRYNLNIYKNHDLFYSRSMGVTDTVELINYVDISCVADLINNDTVHITMADETNNNTINLKILQNSYVIFKTF